MKNSYQMKKSYRINNTTIYLTEETYNEHIHEIEAAIDYLFKNCKNLHSLDFSDVSTGSIQLGGAHKGNPGYLIMIKNIHYNFDNLNDIIKEFIKDWNEFTNEDIESFKSFTRDGEKYGWD